MNWQWSKWVLEWSWIYVGILPTVLEHPIILILSVARESSHPYNLTQFDLLKHIMRWLWKVCRPLRLIGIHEFCPVQSGTVLNGGHHAAAFEVGCCVKYDQKYHSGHPEEFSLHVFSLVVLRTSNQYKLSALRFTLLPASTYAWIPHCAQDRSDGNCNKWKQICPSMILVNKNDNIMNVFKEHRFLDLTSVKVHRFISETIQ